MIQSCVACYSLLPSVENFVFESREANSKMKLIDFGCALYVQDDELVKVGHLLGLIVQLIVLIGELPIRLYRLPMPPCLLH